MSQQVSHLIPYTKSPETLSFEPLKRDVRNTTFATLCNDIQAGLSVALLSIPQAIAYSIAAGVPPIAGLFSTIFGTIIASLFSSSRHLIIGPNNATVVLVQTAACEIFATMYASKMSPEVREMVTLDLMIILTMLIGLIQVIASVFRLGRILQFVSHAVVVGYIAGSALAITIDQLFMATGLFCPDSLETLFQKILHWGAHVREVHVHTVMIAVCSLALLCIFKKKNPLKIVPPSLLMLIVVGAVSAGFGLEQVEDGLGTKVAFAANICEPGTDFFPFKILSTLEIDFTLLNDLIPIAFAIAFIGMLETNSIAKSVAVQSGQTVTSSQDIFSLGCSNLCISFLAALPCSGSMSRTTTNYDSGAKTRFAGIFSGVFVAIIVAFLGPCIVFLPQASLAAILFFAAPKMIDMRQVALCLRATKSDALVICATFFSCIFFSLHVAFYIGVTLSIALHLRRAAVPRMVEYQYDEKTAQMRPMSEEEQTKSRPIRIINVEGELFFGAVDFFQYALKAISEDDDATRVIILRLKHVRDLDATAAIAIRQLKEYLERRGTKLVISSVPNHVLRFLEDAKLIDFLGQENIITFDSSSPKSTLQRAFDRGKALLQRPLEGHSPEERTISGTGSYIRVENPT